MKRVGVVTGTTHGIGLETAKRLAQAGFQVIMLNRDSPRVALVEDHIRRSTGDAEVVSLRCDLANLAAVRDCASELTARVDRIDVLVNNAGVMSGRPQLSQDGFELTLAVNHLGPFLLTRLLLEHLLRSNQGRVVNLASSVHILGRIDFAALGTTERYRTMRAYANSKLATVLTTLRLAAEYANTPLTANCLHPGVVATNLLPADKPLLRGAGNLVRRAMRNPAQAAEVCTHLAVDESLRGTTGMYFSAKGKPVTPSATARDVDLQQRLWHTSERMVGLA